MNEHTAGDGIQAFDLCQNALLEGYREAQRSWTAGLNVPAEYLGMQPRGQNTRQGKTGTEGVQPWTETGDAGHGIRPHVQEEAR